MYRYQEDAYAVCSLAVPQSSLKWNVVDDRLGTGWTPQTLEGFEGEEPPGQEKRRQVACFGIFDGSVLPLVASTSLDTAELTPLLGLHATDTPATASRTTSATRSPS